MPVLFLQSTQTRPGAAGSVPETANARGQHCASRTSTVRIHVQLHALLNYVWCTNRCGALSSLEGLVRYLGIHTSPEDPAFCPDHRAQLCYVCHVVSLVLKNSVVPSDRKPGQVGVINVYNGL